MIPSCFVCDSVNICEHREWELVPHWKREGAKTAPPLKVEAKPVTPYYVFSRMPASRVKRKQIISEQKADPAVPFLKRSGYRLNVDADTALARRA